MTDLDRKRAESTNNLYKSIEEFFTCYLEEYEHRFDIEKLFVNCEKEINAIVEDSLNFIKTEGE